MRGAATAAGVLTTIAVTLAIGLTASAPSAAAPAVPPAPNPVIPVGSPTDIATGLAVPWSILQLHDAAGTVLVSERNTGDIERITSTGGLDKLGTVPGAYHPVASGEGGLLGLATLVDGGTRWIYAYLTTSTDNRIVRMEYTDPGDPADATLGTPQVILSGLRSSTNHNGGRIAFGPDGMLYATVGDTNDRTTPQNLSKLNGKILRMTPTGEVPGDNPFSGSLVYSYGHRNPQGLAWDATGQLWESELGQHTWDEFNRIVPGGNYGWPVVEGIAHDSRYIDPWAQWHTDVASPSGLAYIDGTFFMASLGGKRLWTIRVDAAAHTAKSSASLIGTLGRLRDVAEAPDGNLWILTNNTARGTPKPGDDRIVEVRLAHTQLDRDLTGDGDPDILAVDAPGALELYAGGAGATFAAPATVDAAWAPVATAQVGDFDGDGNADVVGRTTAGELWLYRGDGAGGWLGSTRIVRTVAGQTLLIGPGDWSGDGYPDIIIRDGAGKIWLWRGDGAGGIIGGRTLISTGWNGLTVLPVGDFTGDGRADIVGRASNGYLYVYAGTGAGKIASKTAFSSGWSSYTVFSVGDITGDAKPDILGRDASGALWVYPGTGAGKLSARSAVPGTWTGLRFAS